LLAAARTALQRALGRKAAGASEPPAAGFPIVRRGAFVTLRIGHDLRGCLGHIAADRLLGDLVPELAVAAAQEDPRFPPITAGELDRVTIEISVLSTPSVLAAAEPGAVVIGRDGLIVERGRARGLLLPQVAAEQGWGPEPFLDATCDKAGLPAGAWREPGTRVLTFQADVFDEGV